MRVTFSPPDWDTPARRVRVRRGFIKAGSFPRDDTHVMLLTMFDRTTLKILVVPPGVSTGAGQAALRTGSPADFTSAVNPSGVGAAAPHGDDDGTIGASHGGSSPGQD
jgi:hypothetical protein